MNTINQIIEEAQGAFRERLLIVEETGGLTEEMYIRYLSMQYHLTKGVQKYFLRAAAHPSIMRNNRLRKFLFQFAWEEWPHFNIAAKDIHNSGKEISEIPFDVTLWHAYFNSIIDERPFIRIGAACILENISHRAGDVIDRLFRQAEYLHKDNLVFFTIHRHGVELPHGDQILDAIANIKDLEYQDLCLGAKQGTLMYLRMVDAVISGQELSLLKPLFVSE